VRKYLISIIRQWFYWTYYITVDLLKASTSFTISCVGDNKTFEKPKLDEAAD
jgi:hypothetical protein